MGADEAVAEMPRNHFATHAILTDAPNVVTESPQPAKIPPTLHHTPSLASASARTLADSVSSLEELERAVREFDGCGLKKTAHKTVFADGNPSGNIMVIGEAPGADEDRQGIPFCGVSGQLLDKMLASIDLSRAQNTYITNTVFWRPPGNRQPNPQETGICLPLVEKHIALAAPKLLILVGGVACHTILGREDAISRLRGKSYDYTNPYLAAPIPTMVTYHPSYLLRMPAQKRLAWHDMLQIKTFIKSQSIEI